MTSSRLLKTWVGDCLHLALGVDSSISFGFKEVLLRTCFFIKYTFYVNHSRKIRKLAKEIMFISNIDNIGINLLIEPWEVSQIIFYTLERAQQSGPSTSHSEGLGFIPSTACPLDNIWRNPQVQSQEYWRLMDMSQNRTIFPLDMNDCWSLRIFLLWTKMWIYSNISPSFINISDISIPDNSIQWYITLWIDFCILSCFLRA